MKFTQEMKEGADRFFAALRKFDASHLGTVENAATNVATPVATPTVSNPDPANIPTPTASNAADEKGSDTKGDDPNVTTITELKTAVASIQAELASMKTNLNSTLDANTALADKLATILLVPEKTVKVENNRPGPKEPFGDWMSVLDAKLNRH